MAVKLKKKPEDDGVIQQLEGNVESDIDELYQNNSAITKLWRNLNGYLDKNNVEFHHIWLTKSHRICVIYLLMHALIIIFLYEQNCDKAVRPFIGWNGLNIIHVLFYVTASFTCILCDSWNEQVERKFSLPEDRVFNITAGTLSTYYVVP